MDGQELNAFKSAFFNKSGVSGDSFIWLAANSLPFHTIG
jgi:hypothetical protein